MGYIGLFIFLLYNLGASVFFAHAYNGSTDKFSLSLGLLPEIIFFFLINIITDIGAMGTAAWLMDIRASRSDKRRLLHCPPGFRIRSVLEFFYSRKTMQHVFDPVIADHQNEWQEAMTKDELWHARWIRVRCYWTILTHGGFHRLVATGKTLAGLWKVTGG